MVSIAGRILETCQFLFHTGLYIFSENIVRKMEAVTTGTISTTLDHVTWNMTTSETTQARFNPMYYFERGPVFFTSAERIGVTSYLFVSLPIIYLLNGFYIFLVAKYEEFHTPYFVILTFHAVCELLDSSVTHLSILYISLSGHNPFAESRSICLLHRVLSGGTFLSVKHSLCFLSIERVLFFYRPMWYMRVVTVRKIIYIELAILLESTVFNAAVSVTGEVHFANDRFMCSNTKRIWVFFAQLGGYFFLSMAFALFSIGTLYFLIWKQRRAISCQTRSSEVEEQKPGKNLPPSSKNTGANSNIGKMKTAAKVIGSITGVYWITFVPAAIGTHITVTNIMTQPFTVSLIVKFRHISRFLVFLSFTSWMFNPMIYLYVNPQLRRKVARLARDLCSRR